MYALKSSCDGLKLGFQYYPLLFSFSISFSFPFLLLCSIMTTTVTTASSIIGYKVGNAYKIGVKIGSGSFGEIHRGKHKRGKTKKKKRD